MDGVALRRLIAAELAVPPEQVTDDASFADLGADSLDIISMTMVIEEAFNVNVEGHEAEACATVGDALELVQAKLRVC